MNLKTGLTAINDARKLILIAVVFFTGMSACIKFAAARIPLYETVFFRCIVSAVALGLLIKVRGIGFRARNLPLMLVRSFSGFAAVSCNFYVLGKLSFGDATLLVSTFPVFVALLSFAFLGEKCTKGLAALIVLSMVGIGVILRPQLDFLNFAGFVGLLAAVFSAIVVVVIHQTHETDPSLRIAFYFTGFCAFVSLPIMLQGFVMPTPTEAAFLLGAGVLGTIGQIFMTKAYGMDDVSRLAPLSYIGVVLSFLLGLLFWNEVPDLLTLAGSAIVVTCCVLIARKEKKAEEATVRLTE